MDFKNKESHKGCESHNGDYVFIWLKSLRLVLGVIVNDSSLYAIPKNIFYLCTLDHLKIKMLSSVIQSQTFQTYRFRQNATGDILQNVRAKGNVYVQKGHTSILKSVNICKLFQSNIIALKEHPYLFSNQILYELYTESKSTTVTCE